MHSSGNGDSAINPTTLITPRTFNRFIHACCCLLFVTAAVAQEPNTQQIAPAQSPMWATRPDPDAFDKLENDRIARAKHSIQELLDVHGSRTVANTLAPYDEAIRQLNAAGYFAAVMQAVHPDAAFRDRATVMTTKVSDAQTALSLNTTVYHALAGLDASQADPATRYYLRRLLLEFRLAGVDKDHATREQIKQLQSRLTENLSEFDRNINDDVRTVDTSVAELDGLPQDFIDNHKPAADGKIRLTTNYPDLWPVLTFARSDPLRRSLWLAWTSRAYPKNRKVLEDMMQARYGIAKLLGYRSWADYNAADKMMMGQEHIDRFIRDIDTAVRPIARREVALLLAEKRKRQPDAAELYDYERFYYQELVRRSQYEFDSQSLRPYLPYAEVKQGVLDTAAALFHVSFIREKDAAAWDASVETWDVVDGGQAIGRFYLDMHPRPGKFSHAEMMQVLDGVRGKQLPEAILVCNFPKPTDSDPGLMIVDDAAVFLHEFGHLMHHILGGQQPWAGISGISMETDFAEAPSQMLEEWIHSPQVLRSFAHHYQTGEPVPAELITRMNHAAAFGRAGWVQTQNALAAISFDVYRTAPPRVNLDLLTARDFRRYTTDITLPEDKYVYANFTHLGGYSSMYYTYLWDKAIAQDFFQQFAQGDLLAGDTPMRYRREVLEPGGSTSANDLVRNFLGRPLRMAAFQNWVSAEFAEEKPRSLPSNTR